MIFIRHPFDSGPKYLNFETTTICESDVRSVIVSYYGFKDFSLFHNGRKIQDAEFIPNNSTVHVTFSLPGGKGGFGSMLRAIGAQIEKTTNREACRDLSGRRLRDINEEQRLKKWIAKEAEREAEKIKRRKARIERLKSKPAHKFFDFEYEKEISELPDRVNDALSEGLQKTNLPAKRPAEEAGTSKPPKKAWLSEEFSSSSSDSDSETKTHENESSSKKQKTDFKESDVSDLSQPGPSSSRSDSLMESEESSPFNSDSTRSMGNKTAPKQVQNITNVDSADINYESENARDYPDLSNDGTRNIDVKSISELIKESVNQEGVKEKFVHSGDSQEIMRTEEESNSFTEAKSRCNEDNSVQCLSGDTKGVEPTAQIEANKKETEIASPVELIDFQSVSDLEALGLDQLKIELMSRGLKCGGNLSDRAKRLWQVRGLQPKDYPANILAKNKNSSK